MGLVSAAAAAGRRGREHLEDGRAIAAVMGFRQDIWWCDAPEEHELVVNVGICSAVCEKIG